MNDLKSLLKFGAGSISFVISLIFFMFGDAGSLVLNATLKPDAVGFTTSEIVSKAIEVGLALLTALIGSGVFAKSKWLKMIIDILGPFITKSQTTTTDQFTSDVMKLIAHSISTKNADLTVMLCEELAGCSYISNPDADGKIPVEPTL